MKQVNLKEIGSIVKGANSAIEYTNEIAYEVMQKKLEKIEVLAEKYSDSVCYIVGMGAHPKSTYSELSKSVGVEVAWFDSLMPKYMRFLAGFVASYAGLVKICDTKSISTTFLTLIENSMAGVYIFDKDHEHIFKETIMSDPLQKKYEFLSKRDSSYFYYIVDADNGESSTGIYEIVSYGKNAKLAADWF